jgi:cadmium resistance protein CadD (predicted permease)
LHTFHSFWGAAALSIIVFLFLLPIRGMIMSFIPFGADQLTATPYILNVFSRWQQANIGVLIFGLLLFCTSYWGDRYLLKKSA